MLAASYAAAGELDQAIRWQEQALQIVPPERPAQIQESLRKQVEQYQGEPEQITGTGAAAEYPRLPRRPSNPVVRRRHEEPAGK